MATKTAKINTSTGTIAISNTAAPTKKPSLPSTMEALQYLRTAKNKSDKDIHAILDKALAECTKADITTMLERVMMHIGDVSRQHNVLRAFGINSATGGAQEREIFRSIMRWWEVKLPSSFKKNIPLFAEFTVYENLMYYSVKSDRLKGTILKEEVLLPMPKEVHAYLAEQIRKGKDLNLIAKHLPKYSASKNRVTKKTVKARRGAQEYEWTTPKNKTWVTVNCTKVEPGAKVKVKVGDKLVYPRGKQQQTLKRQAALNEWIKGLCSAMEWDMKQYKAFRSTQNTPEQLFSSKSITKMPKSDFDKLLDGLTAGQRFRVAKMIAYKNDKDQLVPKPKWGELGNWYIDWEKGQEKVATKLREAAASGDVEAKKELMKDLKVKATGIQTIDLLAELFKGGLSAMQINNTYQAMIEKMDLIANVFPIVDGSGSMSNGFDHKGTKISYRQAVYAMAIAFSTRNPVSAFRNTFGWFSERFHIVGESKFKNTAPNPHVASAAFTKKVPASAVLSELKTFTENLKAIEQSDPKEVAGTNMFASIEHFVKLVNDGFCHVEDLPNALLYLTDGEVNTGRSPKEAINLANTIGWNPLLIYWGIQAIPQVLKNDKTPNTLWVSGFNEGALSQILRGIKGGSVDIEDELWSLYEDKRYSLIN